MTISRSEPVAFLVVLAVGALSAPAARAQDSTAARPTTHVVAQGETLWSLAQLYYGDPLLWPEIYRLNTLVVEDPHWIFPGEELRLVPPDTTMVAQAPAVTAPVVGAEQPPVAVTPPPPTGAAQPPVGNVDTAQAARRDMMAVVPVAPPPPPPPAPATESAPTVFREVARTGSAGLPATAARANYRPVRRGDFYSAGFLTENETLPWAQVLGATGRRTLNNLTATSSAQPFDNVSLRAPQGANYHVGDSLLVADLAREIPRWGRVVAPAGIVRVTHVEGRELQAQVIALYSRVTDGQVALPIEPFTDPGPVVPLPVENGTRGQVITMKNEHPVASLPDIVFVNLGRADGIVAGDLFEVLSNSPDDPGAPPRQVALLQVVRVREHSASTLVTHIAGLGVVTGATVRLVRKMPS